MAVVEVRQPWGSMTVCRKLPPLKYYYDFEIGRLIKLLCVECIYTSIIHCDVEIGKEVEH